MALPGIVSAYLTGRGRVYVRARTEIEEMKNGRERIVVTELPYQVNKARLIEKIAELVRDKRIEGIAQDGLRDESDKDGIRVVIELKRGESADVLLNNLYKQTPMQSVFGINMVALSDGQPKLMNLKQVLEAFLAHRREVVTRRTIFDLRKARDQGSRPGRAGCRSRQHRRGHRTDQGVRFAGGGESRPGGQAVDARLGHGDAGTGRQNRHAA